MKWIKMVVPCVAAVLILLVGAFSSRWISYALPSYLDEVNVYDKSSGAGALFVGDEELFIWPWNGYSETDVREVTDDGQREEMTNIFWVMSEQLAVPGAFPGDTAGLALNWMTDGKGFMYLKDCTYIGEDGREYICNMVWKEGDAGLVYYHNMAADMEKGTDETITAAMEELKMWRDPVFSYLDEYGEMGEAFEEDLPEDGAYSSLLMDFLETYWGAFESWSHDRAARGRTVDLLVNAQEDILVYGNELLAVYSAEDLGTLIVYYSPTEKRITGFSMKDGLVNSAEVRGDDHGGSEESK